MRANHLIASLLGYACIRHKKPERLCFRGGPSIWLPIPPTAHEVSGHKYWIFKKVIASTFNDAEYWAPSVLVRFCHFLFTFLIWAQFYLVEWGKFRFQTLIWQRNDCKYDVVNYLENTWKEWPQIGFDDVSWSRSKLVTFWSCSFDFPDFDYYDY